jgi:hypothetical protein
MTKTKSKPVRKSARAAAPKKGLATVGDDAVKKATGKTWDEWCRALDKSGAKELDHKGIVAILHKEFDVGPWWGQMVTVGYEQARGLRKKHEKPDGFSISGNKTIGVPIATLYDAWADAKQRKRWLPDPNFTVRKATAKKSMRVTWVDGTSSVDVMFYAKGAAKSQVSVEHRKLSSEASATRMKAYWKQSLTKLAELLGSE